MTSQLAIARRHVEGQFVSPRRLFESIDCGCPSETGQKEEHLQTTWISSGQGPVNCRLAGKPVNWLVGACGRLAIPDIPKGSQPSPSPNFPLPLSYLFWEILVSLTSKSKKSLKLPEPKHSRSFPLPPQLISDVSFSAENIKLVHAGFGPQGILQQSANVKMFSPKFQMYEK